MQNEPSERAKAVLHAAVEDALLTMADSVAHHLLERSGWKAKDECFQISLKKAQAEIEAACRFFADSERAEEKAKREDVEKLYLGALRHLETLRERIDQARAEERRAIVHLLDQMRGQYINHDD